MKKLIVLFILLAACLTAASSLADMPEWTYPLEPEILDRCETKLSCNCSYDRMARALISLGREELSSLIAEGEPVELVCQFCKSKYTFSVDDLKAMLEAAG